MSNEVLIAIVAINAVVTLSLWRMMAAKANRPAGLNKKAAKALWHSDPIVPRHDPPKVVGGDFRSFVHDADRTFFDDFKEFADVANWLLADEYVASRFRLQELPDGNVRLNIGYDSGPVAGRCFAVYYNQTRIGRLEIHPGFKYTTETPQVYTSVQLDWSRLLGYRTIVEFLGMIASHVTNPNPKSDEYFSARQGIQAALTERLWRTMECRSSTASSRMRRIWTGRTERALRWRGGVVLHPQKRLAEDRRNKQSRCSECAGKVDRPRPDRRGANDWRGSGSRRIADHRPLTASP